MYFNLISTALSGAFNKEGFQLHYLQYKIDRALAYKVSCFPARSNQPFSADTN